MSAREVRYYQDGYATLLKEVNIPEVDPDGTASGTGTGTGTGSGTGTGTGTGTGVLTLDADRTTDYVSQVKFMYSGGSMAMHYDYDRNGSIIQADEGTKKVRYKYDALGRLIREDNQPLDKTYIYEYSINGNITKVREYAYTVSETPSGGTTVNYTYSSNPSRTDRLTAVGGAGVTGYDAAGNPSGYKGASLSWFRGRMLQGYQKGGTAVSYTYDMNGIRRSKTVNGVLHTYFVDGTRIYSEKAGSQVYTYLYDASGITGIRTGGDCYYFLKTQQGDVKYIVSSSGVPQCEYVYDAWGNHRILSAAGEDITDNAQYANSISHINPFRYRGYYYDTETGFYYLNSRYYDPQVRRFINADDPSVPSGEQSTVFGGLNLYAYCGNNPINRSDSLGYFWDTILDIGFIIWGIIDLANGGWKDWTNWVALGADILLAAIPFVPNGVSQVIKLGNKVDNVIDTASAINKLDGLSDLHKVTMVGENMGRLRDAAEVIKINDNLYSMWKGYEAMKNAGKLKRADFISKLHNGGWLYNKLRSGYIVLDAGIDIVRKTRSPWYGLESSILRFWANRHLIKYCFNSI